MGCHCDFQLGHHGVSGVGMWSMTYKKGKRVQEFKNVDLTTTGKKDTKQWYFIA